MQTRPRVYIAGPITKGDLRTNIDQAVKTWYRLTELGFAPYCPHFNCLAGREGLLSEAAADIGIPYETLLTADFEWVKASDAVLRLSGESKGADREVACAKEHSIPVFRSIEDLIVAATIGEREVKRGD